MVLIENTPFLLAGLISLLTTGAHVFVGGPEAARPLMRNGALDRTAQLTLYYCWHLVTFALLGMALGFFLPAFGVGDRSGAALWTAIAFGFAIWSVALSIWKRQSQLALPQWAFFAPITALGVWGLV